MNSHDAILVSRITRGAVAGAIATVPMTMVMKSAYSRLPASQQYPLPPRRIAEEAAQDAGVAHRINDEQMWTLTVVSHFAYGALCGAAYTLLMDRVPLPRVIKGVGFGLGVWAASYSGWLPAVGWHPPASQEPRQRNALMISAHATWGAATGLLAGQPPGSRRTQMRGGNSLST